MTSVVDYFAEKADRYDDTDKQAYWVFSDELLWGLLKEHFLSRPTNSPFIFLDAGGGTGRWTLRILKEYPQSRCLIIDISADMLAVAKEKFARHGYSDRVKMIQDDLCTMDCKNKDRVDFAICLHNVIGFVHDPQKALIHITSLLQPSGRIALMAPSYYHALYFSNANNRPQELARILRDRAVCYNDKMPPLRVFEIDEVNQLFRSVGLHPLDCYGFPITLYPGMDETFIEGQTKHLSNLLSHSEQSLFDLEKRLCADPKMAPRGNNILFLAKKQGMHS